jgi:uncharacterized protein (DUF305 family)
MARAEPEPVFPMFEAHAKHPALKELLGRLAEFERQRTDLRERMVAALERDRPQPMTRGEKRTMAAHTRIPKDQQLKPADIAALDDPALYRLARMAARDELMMAKMMGTQVYSNSPEAQALATEIIENLRAASELVRPETFPGL